MASGFKVLRSVTRRDKVRRRLDSRGRRRVFRPSDLIVRPTASTLIDQIKHSRSQTLNIACLDGICGLDPGYRVMAPEKNLASATPIDPQWFLTWVYDP